MPHNSIKLIPGVNTTKTMALNETGLSASNLVRFLPDRAFQLGQAGTSGMSLVQKIGGWVLWFVGAIGSIVKNLHAWEDLNSNQWLAAGATAGLYAIEYGSAGGLTTESGNIIVTETGTPSYSAYGLLANSPSINNTITPQTITTNPKPNFTLQSGILLTESSNTAPTGPSYGLVTEAGTANYPSYNFQVATPSQTVTVIDTGSNTRVGDVVYIETQVSVGGGTIQGVYPIASVIDANTYTINVSYYATSETTNGGTLPTFTSFANTGSITVNYPNHGYTGGETVVYVVQTVVGGVDIFGSYTVSSIVDANNYKIIAQNQAAFAQTATMNFGNVLNLYYLNLGPAGLITGYGLGGYGYGGYGIGQPSGSSRTGTAITATDWSLDNYGQLLIASPYGGPIYYWQPNGPSQTALIFNNAPIVNNGTFVAMPQRQIVAYGSTFNGILDPLLIRWCDVGNPNVWNASSVNQAGSYRIPEGSLIVAAFQTPQQALFWTDESVWSMQYIGAPLVYSFNKIGSGVGAISQKSIGVLNNVIFWMSPSQFNMLSPNGISNIPCTVWDVVFQNLNTAYTANIRCATNSLFNEVTWYYPSNSSTTGENDSYVKYNINSQTWDYGFSTPTLNVGRTAWIDQSVLGSPIGAGTDTYIYQHEIGNDAASGSTTVALTPSFETGYFALTEGDNMVFIDQMWPDMKWTDYGQTNSASLQITFYGTNYPGDTPTTYGPYTVTQSTEYISTRIRNRLLAFSVSSSDLGSFWRLGNLRYRYQPDGKY